MVKRMVISAHAWARRYQRGLSPSLFYVCDERHRERSVSLMHCYQREFFNETERHQWRTAWRSSGQRAADVDRDRREVPDGRPGRGLGGGPPSAVVAEHRPRLCHVTGPVVDVPGTARRGREVARSRGPCVRRVPVLAAQRPHRRARPRRARTGARAGDVGGEVGCADLLLSLAGGSLLGAGRGPADARDTTPGPGPRTARAPGCPHRTGPVLAGEGPPPPASGAAAPAAADGDPGDPGRLRNAGRLARRVGREPPRPAADRPAHGDRDEAGRGTRPADRRLRHGPRRHPPISRSSRARTTRTGRG
jgi:hypothetical protein